MIQIFPRSQFPLWNIAAEICRQILGVIWRHENHGNGSENNLHWRWVPLSLASCTWQQLLLREIEKAGRRQSSEIIMIIWGKTVQLCKNGNLWTEYSEKIGAVRKTKCASVLLTENLQCFQFLQSIIIRYANIKRNANQLVFSKFARRND